MTRRTRVMIYSAKVDPALVARVRKMVRCCGVAASARYCGTGETTIEKVDGNGLARVDVHERLVSGVTAWESGQPCPPARDRSQPPSKLARKAAA